MFADERLPRRIGSAHGRRLETVTIQNSGDGAWTEGDSQLGQPTLDAVLTPGRILNGHPDDHLLDFVTRRRLTGSGFLDAQLPLSIS